MLPAAIAPSLLREAVVALPGTPAASLGELGERTLSRVRRRVLPLMVWLYFIAFLDRNNVGFAKLTMSEDIGLTATAYGLGAGIFFIGYAIFEVPSNAGMHRYGARKWIARILVTWGICATAMAAVQGVTSFYIIRFLLGAAEAGFFPAVILYLTYWFPAAQRVAVLGLFILAQPLANAIGAPVSGLLLKMDGSLGLDGWRWMYIVEGLPAILMGFVVLFAVTDRPKDAMWLAPEERRWLQDTMDAEDAAKAGHGGGHSFMAGLKDPRALIYAALYFGLVMGIYGLSLWLPSIVKAMGNLSTTQVGFIVPIPYICAALFVLYWSRHSDRTGERVGHATFSMLLAAAGLVASGLLLQASPVLAMVTISVCAMGIFSAISPFWELPSAALAGAAAAAGIALINSLGNLGGFAAPYAVGYLVDRTGDAKAGLFLLAGVLAITAAATFLYGRRTGAGTVPTASHEDVLAKEAAAFDLPADELHHRGDPDVADTRGL
jgi:ACS family tartrate transporter-like MFS transporter